MLQYSMNRAAFPRFKPLAVVFASILAVGGILLWLYFNERSHSDWEARATAQQFANEAVRDYKVFSDRAVALLRAISPLVPGSNCAAEETLTRMGQVQFDSLELYDRSGRPLCNTARVGAVRGVGRSDWFQAALGAVEGGVSASLFRDSRRRASLRFAVPVLDRQHRVVGVASLVLSLASLGGQIFPSPPPGATQFSFVDGNGNSLDSDTPHDVTSAGKMATLADQPPTYGMVGTGPERLRVVRSLGLKGEQVYILEAVTPESVMSGIHELSLTQILLIVLVFLLLGTTLWFGVDMLILGRVRRLAVEARRLTLSSSAADEARPGRELDHLSAVFDQLAEALQVRNAEQEVVREMRDRFEVAMRGTSDGLWDWNLRSDSVYYSPRYFQMLGYEEGEFPHSTATFNELVHPDDANRVWRELQAYLSGNGDHYSCEFRMHHKEGHWRWILGRGVAIRDEQGTPARMVGTNVDITVLKHTQEAMIAEKERVLVTLGSIGDAVISVSARGTVEYLNPAAAQLLGCRLGDVQSKVIDAVFVLSDEMTSELLENPVHRCLRGESTLGTEGPSVMVRGDGRKVFVEHNVAPIRDAIGWVIGAVMVMRDVTEQRRIAEELSFQATHDALTGLINRFEFERRLKRVIATAANDDSQHAMCYLDLDQFKVVNDTCGHAAGDQLLHQLGQLLRSKLRKRDTLGRLGGDEFGVLLERCPPERARRIALSLVEVVNEFRFEWEGKRFAVGVSIGLVSFGADNGGVQGIMTAADTSCYAAKDRGRNRVHIYEAHDQEVVRRQGEMHWVSRITQAIEDDRLFLYAQPIMPLQSAVVAAPHYEVLLRLQDEKGELIPPGAFIPAAERYNLMGQIDRWVIRRVCELLSRKGRGDSVALPVCDINLSGHSLSDESLQAFIREQLERHQVPPEALCFEITETAAIANLSTAREFIHDLRKLGCAFALDDFGSGMSSFSYLKSLQVDYLKIDGAFVKDIAEDPVDRAIVNAINIVGHTLGIKTIAEYAESHEIIKWLTQIGVDFAQGYGFAAPMPVEQVIPLKSSRTSRQWSVRV
jgi:diguanylate cyclase (GGDEF)-like protein/PAS domain S-box-containing protein